MRMSRTLVIRDRVFSLEDLQRVSRVIAKEAERSREAKHRLLIDFQVTFSDDSSIQSDVPDILATDVMTRPDRPVAFRSRYLDYEDVSELSISISHGESRHGNQFVVSSENDEWVKAVFLSVKEVVDSARRQDLWFKRHPKILFHLIALGIGTLIMLIVTGALDILVRVADIPIKPLPEDSPWRTSLDRAQPVFYALQWLSRWAMGLWWAFDIRSWLLRLWPDIELDIGPDHLKIEKNRRGRLRAVGVLVVVPLLLSAAYDVVKYVLNRT